MNVGTLTSFLKLDRSDYTSGMNQAQQQAKQMDAELRKMEGASKQAESSMIGLGKAAVVAAAAIAAVKVAEFARHSVDEFTKFQSATVDMGKVTSRSFAQISAEIKALPKELGSATQLMTGYYEAMSAGVSKPAEAMALLTTAAKASNAAHVEQAEVITATTKLMSGFEGQIRSATEATDLMFKIEEVGQTKFRELVPVIGEVAKISKDLTVSQYEMGAALAQMTQYAGSTAQAATQYKAVLFGLYKPQKNMEELFERTGYASGQAMVQQLGLSGSIQLIKAEAEKTGITLGKFFESTEALLGISELGARGWEEYEAKLKSMGSAAGATEKAFAEWRTTFEATKQVFNNTIGLMAIEMGEKIAPVLQTSMEGIANNIDKITSAMTGLLKVVGVGSAIYFLPAAFTAVTATVLALRLKMEMLFLVAKTGGITALLTTPLWGTTVAATAATVAIGKLKIASGVLFTAYAGWEIGKWLSDSFEEARLAGILFVNVTGRGVIEIESAAKRAWAGIGNYWDTMIGTMKDAFAGFLLLVGKGLNKVPGAGGAADAVTSYANSIEGARTSNEKYKKTLSEIATELERNRSAHQKTIDSMVATAMGLDKVITATNDAADAAKKKDEITQTGGAGIVASTETQIAAAKALTEHNKAILDSLEPLRVEQEKYNEALEILNQMDPTQSTARYIDALGKLNESTTEATENQNKLNEALAGVQRRVDNYESAVSASLPAQQREIAAIKNKYAELRKGLASHEIAAQHSAAELARISDDLITRQTEDIAKVTDGYQEQSDSVKKIWESMYTNLQSLTADWLYDMKISWASLGDLFRRMVAQMVSAWLWGQTTMAAAGTSPSLSGGTAGGSSLAAAGTTLASIGGAAAIGSTMAGPSDSKSAMMTTGVGLAGVAMEAYSGTTGAAAAALQANIGSAIGGSVSEELGGAIMGMADAAFAGWAAGIGTFVIGLLQGKSFQDAAIQGIGAGVGAWGGMKLGATAGSYFGPIGTVIGGALGTIIGSVAGSWLGSLMGSGGKENEFTLTELVPSMTTAFDKNVGMIPTDWQHGNFGNEWYHGIANAYSDIIGTIQEDFNKNVFAFANELPEDMRDLLLDNLAATDFMVITTAASGGRWGVSAVQESLEGVVQRYADGLAKAVNDAYKAALITFVQVSDPSALLGADLQGTWSVLSEAAQLQVKSMFEAAGQVIAESGIEAGIAELNKISAAVASIKSAIAPIQEIIDTEGMSDYEKQLRSINKQFDDYGVALIAAGVDLSKYTAFEKVRGIVLAEVVNPAIQESIDKEKELVKARSGVMATINEILATDGMSQYELSLRSVNKQFDDYADTLRENSTSFSADFRRVMARFGATNPELADMAKLEQARALTLAKVVNPAIQESIDKFSSFAKELRKFKDSLLLGNLSTLTPQEKYNEAQREFDKVSLKAQQGDAEAMGQLPGAATSFLDISHGLYASSDRYATDFARVSMALDNSISIADQNVTAAEQQLSVMSTQAATLLTINDSVLSVRSAIDSIGGFTATSMAASDDYIGGFTATSMAASDDYGDYDYSKLRNTPAFANGGFHSGGLRLVGENGPELEATGPSRVWNQSQLDEAFSGGNNKELIAEIRLLREEIATSSNKATGAQIQALFAALDKAANKIVDGGKDNSSKKDWQSALAPKRKVA